MCVFQSRVQNQNHNEDEGEIKYREGRVEWAIRLKKPEGPESGGLGMGTDYQGMFPHRGSLLFQAVISLVFLLFIYLAAQDLSYGTQDLHVSCELFHCSIRTLQLWHGGLLLLSMWDLSSLTRDQTCIACVARQTLNQWTTREVPRLLFQVQCRLHVISQLIVQSSQEVTMTVPIVLMTLWMLGELNFPKFVCVQLLQLCLTL